MQCCTFFFFLEIYVRVVYILNECLIDMKRRFFDEFIMLFDDAYTRLPTWFLMFLVFV